MKKIIIIIAGVLSMLALAGCSDKVSWETQEASRQAVIDNVTFNATTFRAANHRDLGIKVRGDSTISADCPSGDGFASVDLIDTETGVTKVELKCSTVSGTIGCMTKADFLKRPQFNSQENHCDSSLPFPIPKIVK